MGNLNKINVGVFGNESSNHLSKKDVLWIKNLGSSLATTGCTLFTGGGDGIMQIVRSSCIKNKGFTVSIIPEINVNDDSSKDLGFTIAAGLGKTGRVSLLVQSIDIGISIGGGSGTLMEIITCYLMAKPVIIMDAFHKINDPIIMNILNRVEEIEIEDQIIKRGYLDSKDRSIVEPVTICYPNLSPDQILKIGIMLYKRSKNKTRNNKE